MLAARQAEASPAQGLRTQELLAAEGYLEWAAVEAEGAAFECKFRTP